MSDGKAHFPRGMVRNEPNGIDGFPGRAGSDQELFPGKILLAGDFAENILEQHAFLRHPAVPGIAVCQHPRIGGHDLIAVARELFEVILHDGVVVHIMVHGRSHDFFAGTGHDRGGKHIVRNAVCELADHVGGRRGDHHHVRLLCKGDVLHAVLEVPVKCVDEALVRGQRLEGDGVNEIRGVSGHHHLYVAAELFEHPGKICDFIGGDAAGNGKHRGFSFEMKHGESSFAYLYHISTAPKKQRIFCGRPQRETFLFTIRLCCAMIHANLCCILI